MAANLPNLVKETDIQVQETQKVPNKMNQLQRNKTGKNTKHKHMEAKQHVSKQPMVQ